MDPEWKAIFFTIAIVLFAIETFLRRSLLAGGLAAAVIPFWWDAIDAA